MNSLKKKINKIFYKAKARIADFYFWLKSKIINFKKEKRNFYSKQTTLDQELIYSLSKSKVPSLKQLKYIKKFLNPKEFKIIKICFFVIFLSALFLGANFYKAHLQVVPVKGGEYIEGLVGAPKHINPLYASASDADGDISNLIFSSLFKRDINGELLKDLVLEYQISEDNKSYTFKIRNNVKWHNGEKLKIDDIIFTFNAIKDIDYSSPLRSSFIGVTAEKIDEESFKFVLAEPYAAFLNLLTFGIMPQNMWLSISPKAALLAELNLKPVGSGPYKFNSLLKDKSGNIRTYNLVLNKDYYNKQPFVEKIIFNFFVNFEEAINALNENAIDGISYLPLSLNKALVAKDSLNFHNLNLPQLTAIFFNQEMNFESTGLNDLKVRKALTMSLNKEDIVDRVFSGSARLIDSPILPDSFAYYQNILKYNLDLTESDKLLNEAGWEKATITTEDIIQAEIDKDSEDEKLSELATVKIILGEGEWRKKKDKNNYLIITLTTIDNKTNLKVVEKVKENWEKLGIKTVLNIVPVTEMQTQVIRPRNFEALFYGQAMGGDPDPYAFWHSSRVGESGLNIANYANNKVDKLLEDARLTTNNEERVAKYKEFQEILAADVPAVFMYSPVYTYVQDKKIKSFSTKNIISSHDRFSSIVDWYVKTGKRIVW